MGDEVHHIYLVEELFTACHQVHAELSKLERMLLADAESIGHPLTIRDRVIYIQFLLESGKSCLQRGDPWPSRDLTKK